MRCFMEEKADLNCRVHEEYLGIQCPAMGMWNPVLLITPEDSKGMLAMYLNFPICGWHKGKLELEDVLDDKGWEQVDYALQIAGRAAAKRDLTVLHWERRDL